MDNYLIRYRDKKGQNKTTKIELYSQPYEDAVEVIKNMFKLDIFCIIKS